MISLHPSLSLNISRREKENGKEKPATQVEGATVAAPAQTVFKFDGQQLLIAGLIVAILMLSIAVLVIAAKR